MQKDNLVYIGHMYDFSQSAIQKVASIEKSTFAGDDTLQLAVAHLVQMIGEAARLITDEFKGKHSDIPWSQITGMRHKIVHDYFSIDMDIVWDVAKYELPKLMPLLAAHLPKE